MAERVPDDAAARLADAAARLKARAEPASREQLEALEGLADARLEVRRARARLAELEAHLHAVFGAPRA
jgi:hypothetical protein